MTLAIDLPHTVDLGGKIAIIAISDGVIEAGAIAPELLARGRRSLDAVERLQQL